MTDAVTAAQPPAPPTYEEVVSKFVVDGAQPTKEETPNADEIKAEGAETTTAEAGAETTETDSAEEGAGDTPDASAADGGDKSTVGENAAGKPKLTAAQRHAEIQSKTNELTRQLRETERRVAEALAKLEQTDTAALTPKARDTTVVEGDAPPDPAKFEYGELDGRYIEAKIAHGVKSALTASEAKAEKTRQADAAAAKQQEIQQAYTAFEKAGTDKYSDFNEVVVESAKNGDWKPTAVLAELILTSKEGPDVAYHLASNPKEAREIAGKSPLEQAAYFGRLAAKFPSKSPDAPAKPAVKTTQAPPPVKAVRGGSGATGFDPKTASYEDFERHMRSQK